MKQITTVADFKRAIVPGAKVACIFHMEFNRRNVRYIRYNGKVKTISQWSTELNISRYKAAKLK